MADARRVEKGGPRKNEEIRIPRIKLISSEGKMLGEFDTRDARRMAESEGFDLVEISPNEKPPICKIMDYGKYLYEQKKAQNESRKKQHVVSVKEIQLRPMIAQHDLDTKIRHIKEFLDAGDKVKISVRFSGREMAHQEYGHAVVTKIIAATGALFDTPSKMEGKTIICILRKA